ncbi:MAG: hypothetical protein QOG84_935, partial [Sphingomonadales bacterium]|nr:hypothetical protein [Sphingomonadales bacterium]
MLLNEVHTLMHHRTSHSAAVQTHPDIDPGCELSALELRLSVSL